MAHMTTIGITADTHSRPLPARMIKDFAQADIIIHAGDFCAYADYLEFKRFVSLKAVRGNMDDARLRKLLPERLIVEWEGRNIGVYHGEGRPDQVLDGVIAQFKGELVDAVVFGHSHIPFNREIDGVLYINPGSPTDVVTADYPSYALLQIKGGRMSARIIRAV